MANLSRLPEELVEVIERWCRGERAEGAQGKPGERKRHGGRKELRMGPCYGVLCGLHEVARRMGLVAALGSGRMAKLALFLIYALVARQGSRLGAARWAVDHAVAEVLGLEKIDEDDLYEVLDWLQANQERIERALVPKAKAGAFFLYDVTSSYFEGQCNEFAAYGYNRDGKKHNYNILSN
jgi:hypothetical protein